MNKKKKLELHLKGRITINGSIKSHSFIIIFIRKIRPISNTI